MKRPLKVISATLSLILASQLLLISAQAAETPSPSVGSSKLVEWSNEDVKAFYDPQVDWKLPIPSDKAAASPSPSPTPTAGSGTSSASSTTVFVNQAYGGSGFGWDDLLLYHLIFNTVSPYSSSSWGSSHRSYYYRSNTPYVTKTYQASSFTNRSATKTPTTSSGSGTFKTNSSSTTTKSGTSSSVGSTSSNSSKSTSTSSGSIGGKSSGFSSSSGG